VPRRLREVLQGHDVRTLQEMGWADLDDGPLLEAIAGRFDALVKVDKHLPKQQRLEGRPFEVIVLHAKTNRLADLVPLVPECCLRFGSREPARRESWALDVAAARPA
jgi:hypothetical protein